MTILLGKVNALLFHLPHLFWQKTAFFLSSPYQFGHPFLKTAISYETLSLWLYCPDGNFDRLRHDAALQAKRACRSPHRHQLRRVGDDDHPQDDL
jgi:hypothetical protein